MLNISQTIYIVPESHLDAAASFCLADAASYNKLIKALQTISGPYSQTITFICSHGEPYCIYIVITEYNGGGNEVNPFHGELMKEKLREATLKRDNVMREFNPTRVTPQ